MALLALLAAAPRGLSRDKILAYLWPESETEQGRNALYNLLFRVRRSLGSDAIVGSAELSLDPAIVGSDLRDFDDAVRAGAIDRAAQLYTGPFLDGFYLREAPEFERWADDERARRARVYLDLLERLAVGAAQAGDRRAAANWWRQRADAEPLSARAALGYIDALAAAGDRETALSFASVYAALVREELGTEPDATVTRRVDELRRSVSPSLPPGRVAPTPASKSLSAEEASRDTTPHALHSIGWWTKRRLVTAGVVGCALVGILATARYAATTSLDAHRVVVATFDNQTGDTALDLFGHIVADGISEQLARTGFVKVVDPATALASSRRIRDSIAQLGSSPALQMLSRATHAGLVVTGSYFRDGNDLVVQARITDAVQNQVLAATEQVRGPFSDRAAVLDTVRQRVMGALALHLDERLATIMPEGLSPTYEAYESFIAGLEIFTTGHSPDAAPYFARAYALDTTFAEPLIWEAFAVGNLVKRDSIVQILERHRASLSQIDRYALDYHKAVVSGSLEERLVAARNAARLAPGSDWTHNVATALAALGKTREAIDVWSTIDREHGWVASWPGFWMGYIQALHVSGMRQDELQIAREAHRALPANFTLQEYEAIALAMNGKWGEFDQRVRAIEQRTYAEWELWAIGAELHLHGDESRARQIQERLVRWYSDRAATGAHDLAFRGEHARALYLAGHWADAALLSDSLRTEDPRNRLWFTLVTLARARAGERARAATVLDSLVESATGLGAVSQLVDAARIAAVLGQRDRAVELLQQARQQQPNAAWRHYAWNSFDFDSLGGYPPFERLTAGR